MFVRTVRSHALGSATSARHSRRWLGTSLIALLLLSACSLRDERTTPRFVVFTGMCDASGAVPLSGRLFAVADDEDNSIRVYDAEKGGGPLDSTDLSKRLNLPVARKKKKSSPETDIEAATRIGELAFWITSHGRNSSGKPAPERFRFFATTASALGSELDVVGQPYESLLADLEADPRYAPFQLAEASTRAPKAEGGLNIEGMTRREAGGVFIGFRSPVPKGRALIATLLNPEAVVRGSEPARFGPPITLDLTGLGVRGLSLWRGRYLVIAGDPHGARSSQLYVWDGAEKKERLPVDLSSFNPEGFVTIEERERIMLLSDDGTSSIDGRECKRLKDSRAKRFRGMWLEGYELHRR